MNKFGFKCLLKEYRNAIVPHANERVELAYQILKLRHKLRLIHWDPEQFQKLRAQLEQLEQRLREIAQGARLIGIYDSHVTHGQSRVLLVWTRLIMPNGRSIVLERQPGADTAGYAGLNDEVDLHWGELFKAASLSTLLGVGAELGSGSDTVNGSNAILQALRRGAGDSLNQTGQQIVRRNLNIQPTLTIRPGFAVRVIVNRDLVLEPYRG
jgi:type IV secretion system protein TrbI